MLKAALWYLKQGFSVIPFKPDKSPILRTWNEYQKRLPTEAEVAKWWDQHQDAMIAVVGGKLSGVCMLDCDSEDAYKKLCDVIGDDYNYPTTITPRPGYHIFFKNIPFNSRNAVDEKIDFKGEGGLMFVPPSKRPDGQYKFIKGLELTRKNLLDMPQSLIDFLKSKTSQDHIEYSKNVYHEVWSNGVSEGNRNNTMTKMIGSWIKHGLTIGECRDMALTLNRKNNPPLSDRELDTILKSLFTREYNKKLYYYTQSEKAENFISGNNDNGLGQKTGIGNEGCRQNIDKVSSSVDKCRHLSSSVDKLSSGGNLADDVKDWVLSSDGTFLINDIYRDLELSNRTDKKNCSKILGRLVFDRIIKRVPGKNGQFCKVEDDVKVMDLVNVSGEFLNIEWPLGVENLAAVAPKAVVVVAGETNAGKTAFLLNLVRMNQDKFKIWYFNSEMSEFLFRNRLDNFGETIDTWKFNPVERSSNFADVIKPDDFNIIDFLEVQNGEYFKLGQHIKDIFDRLNKGIAVIALQKKKDQDWGRGGEITGEKPQLYLSISPGKVKIIKAKTWTNSEWNPQNMECKFKLYQGCKFMPITGWTQTNAED